VDDATGLLCDCRIVDLSGGGARLRIPSAIRLPGRFRLFLDETATLLDVRLAWRRGDLAGILIAGSLTDAEALAQCRRLAGRFYALAKP
jgi:hypothetical protein